MNEVQIKKDANKLASVLFTVITVVLFLAYLLQYVKGEKDLMIFIALAVTDLAPMIVCWVIYKKTPDSALIRHIIGIGYGIFYVISCFVNKENILVFVYAVPMVIVITLFNDLKFSIRTAVGCTIVSLVHAVWYANLSGFSSSAVASLEIEVALMIMVAVFITLVNKHTFKVNSKRMEMINETAEKTQKLLDEVMDVLINKSKAGKEIVRLHTGEPSIYGAVQEQMQILDKNNISYDSCPGVSACFGAAASLNLEYTLPDISQSLIITRMAGRTSVPESESIEEFARHKSTMAIYLSTGMLKELSKKLIAGGYSQDTPAAIVYKASWPDEQKFICTVGTMAETAQKAGIKNLAVVLVGDVISKSGYSLSKLYSPDFETGYRGIRDDNK